MFRKSLSFVLCITLTLGGISMPVSAAVIGTQEGLAADARQAQIAAIHSELSRADVQQAMISMGVSPEQAQLRVASLSNSELSRLQSELDSLPAGGSFLALVGAVFVVLLILELTGVINIFNKP